MSDKGSQEDINEVYRERNIAVSLAVKLAEKLDLPVWSDATDIEWQVVFIELPSGQVSWHIPRAEMLKFFPALAHIPSRWDGHSTDEKNARITEFN